MIGIVVALKSEAEPVLNIAKNVRQIPFLDKIAYECEIGGEKAIFVISGIGKVSASLSAQRLIDVYSPDYIMNFGTAGGTNDSVFRCGYYAVDNCCQYDFDVTELDDVSVGYIQEYDTVLFKVKSGNLPFLKKRNLASGDRFSNGEKDALIVNSLGCSLKDMEGGAIAQVARSNDVDCYIIKGVTDVYGVPDPDKQFFENLLKVNSGFKDLIPEIITFIKNG